MAGNSSVLTAHMGSGYDIGISNYDLLYLAVPFSGVFAVGPDELFHIKMLVGIVPIDPGIGMKVFTDGCIRRRPAAMGAVLNGHSAAIAATQQLQLK